MRYLLRITVRINIIVILNFFKVSPFEIEKLLCSHPGVKDAAVIGIPHPECLEAPKAFVVKEESAEMTEEELITFTNCKFFMIKSETYFQENILARLPEEKRLWGGIEFIDTIPKGKTGKVLRRVLKERGEKKCD